MDSSGTLDKEEARAAGDQQTKAMRHLFGDWISFDEEEHELAWNLYNSLSDGDGVTKDDSKRAEMI